MHPQSRLARLRVKDKLDGKKKRITKEERASKVWRKLTKEDIKREETEDDLRSARSGNITI